MLFNGQYKKYDIYRCLEFYFKTPGKKQLGVTIKELVQLTIHWKNFPYQYFQFEMFLNSCDFTLQEMKNYISNRQWFNVIDASMTYSILCDDKALFSDLLRSNNLPQPKLLLKYRKGTFLNHRNELLTTFDVNEIISSQQCKRIFVKDALGFIGSNIEAYDREENGTSFVNGSITLTAENIMNNFPENYLIIQEGIVQTKVLSKVNIDSVNTIRILTRIKKGEVSIIAAAVRFGREGRIIDNAHAGGISVGIDIETGKLKSFAKAYYDSERYYSHPDTGVFFNGIQLNLWDQVKSTAINAARSFYQIEFIGWDIVITDSGVLILEMNKRPCIHFQQMTCDGLANEVLN